MKKTLLCLALSLSGMAIAQNQTNLLKNSDFSAATGFENHVIQVKVILVLKKVEMWL